MENECKQLYVIKNSQHLFHMHALTELEELLKMIIMSWVQMDPWSPGNLLNHSCSDEWEEENSLTAI